MNVIVYGNLEQWQGASKQSLIKNIRAVGSVGEGDSETNKKNQEGLKLN